MHHFLRRGFDRAADLLAIGLDEASATVTADPTCGQDFPSVYGELAWPNVKWIKVHRYWFSYTTEGEPVIFDIIWDAANIPPRAIAPTMPDPW